MLKRGDSSITSSTNSTGPPTFFKYPGSSDIPLIDDKALPSDAFSFRKNTQKINHSGVTLKQTSSASPVLIKHNRHV